ncbi:hypothetical protein PT277_05370 [Acetobacteraceae bacterium ESL0709]|nr:hypothetical protein [Acetobacteraceae bacterium ESL0697]MDF7678126.1 hypothetical protein [Acetobacteraceae bacterium ESL0709]
MRVWTRQWQSDGSRRWVAVTDNQAIIAWVQNLLLLQKGECPGAPSLGRSVSRNNPDGALSDLEIRLIEQQVEPYVDMIRIARIRSASAQSDPVYNVTITFADGTNWSSGRDKFNQSYSQTGPFNPGH